MMQHLFILGAGRSGTKIFRDCLGAANDVAAIPYDVGYIWRIGNERCSHDQLLPEHLSEVSKKTISTVFDKFCLLYTSDAADE